MRSTSAVFVVALITVATTTNAPLPAQVPVSGSRTARCSRGNRFLDSGAGALVGAFLGLVGAKIKMSDWTDASRTDAATALRNRATIGAAVVGAVIGSFGFRDHGCDAGAAAQPATAPQSDWRQPITVAEIERAGVTGSVYDLVYSLRRNWLYTRGADAMAPAPDEALPAPGEPQLEVFLDAMPLGTVSRLRELPIAGVLGVRYFDPAAATYRWGGEYSHGVIEVVTTTNSDN